MSTVKKNSLTKNILKCHFFGLRTPALPVEELLAFSESLQAASVWRGGADPSSVASALTADVKLCRARVTELLSRADVTQALFIASPSLESGLRYWKANPDSKKGLQAERALVRYFSRMCFRSTPFGLFSGCSVGQVVNAEQNASPQLALQPQTHYRSFTRLDFEYLFALTNWMTSIPEVADRLVFRPNSSLHSIANAHHYIESRRTPSATTTQHLVRLDQDEFLNAVLDRARDGAMIEELVQCLVGIGGDSPVSGEEAKEFVQELIKSDVLVSSLVPHVTGRAALDDLITQIKDIEALKSAHETLTDVREAMLALDKNGPGATPQDYRNIAAKLQTLPPRVDAAKLYQVDMIKPVDRAVLPQRVVGEIARGIDALCRISRRGETESLRLFRERFLARYDRAMVPLVAALDEELGVGFAPPPHEPSTLLRGVPPNGPIGPAGAVDSITRILLSALASGGMQRKTEIELDIASLPEREGIGHLLPNSFSASVTLVAESAEALDRDDFEFRLWNVAGPSGVTMLGRFCHLDQELEASVKQHLRQEESHDPHSVFAEIVHLPEGRIGNVLCRPLLREYEIVYLGRSGAPADRQLLVADLLVGVRNGRIVLFSRKLGKQVIPRLTNAHGFMNPKLGSMYRFLCLLQQQGVALPSFSWGTLDALDYLPRVRIGRMVVANARWRLTQKEVEQITAASPSECFVAVQNLRRELNLPRWVVYPEADHVLPVDLDNPLSIAAFAHVLKRGRNKILREMYPSPSQLCVNGPEGRFYHEVNIPFLRDSPPENLAYGPRWAETAISLVPQTGRSFPPGSNWLFVKIYCGHSSADEFLLTCLAPILNSPLHSGLVSNWHFIRYGDPDHHLRLRFRGVPERLLGKFLPGLYDAATEMLSCGKISRVQLDTYEREIERYGGLEGTECAEDVFAADSKAVLEILKELGSDDAPDLRWQLALMGTDQMLSDFDLDIPAKRSLMSGLVDSYKREGRDSQRLHERIGERFRLQRKLLLPLIEGSSPLRSELAFARTVFEARSKAVQAVANRLRALSATGALGVGLVPELVSSYVHMHINRLISSSARQHERLIYDFLFRLYDSRLARDRKGSIETH
jgi:thiopeptide-type bacteriocin biosynthesis protein